MHYKKLFAHTIAIMRLPVHLKKKKNNLLLIFTFQKTLITSLFKISIVKFGLLLEVLIIFNKFLLLVAGGTVIHYEGSKGHGGRKTQKVSLNSDPL